MNTHLQSLLAEITILQTFGRAPQPSYHIENLCTDSRVATVGDMFLCVKGYCADGHNFAAAAYHSGVRIFVVERPLDLPQDAYQIQVENARIALARLSAAHYEHPAKKLHMIGLTGTKGKTTTALFIKQILDHAGIPTGYIGTNGVSYGEVHEETANSTPESILLQKYLSEMVTAGVKVAVLEVSSQGLWMHRVEGISFDTCLFTNLSSDHVGAQEHETFEHYMACKKLLFTQHSHKDSTIICNMDDPAAPDMLEGALGRVVYVSTQNMNAPYVAHAITSEQHEQGLSTSFLCRIWDTPFAHPIVLPMVGEFNVKNALCAMAVAWECFHISPEVASEALATVQVAGRFETLVFPSLPEVKFVIDYAHNGLSMAVALDALRACHPKRLICVFGSVGSRSHARRAELARAAGRRADLCILTSDNPNAENPIDILMEIDAAFPAGSCPRELIPDRQEALARAVDIAQPGDIILLAGKGHEHTQVMCGKTFHYNEKETLETVVLDKKTKHPNDASYSETGAK